MGEGGWALPSGRGEVGKGVWELPAFREYRSTEIISAKTDISLSEAFIGME